MRLGDVAATAAVLGRLLTLGESREVLARAGTTAVLVNPAAADSLAHGGPGSAPAA